jgi:hypothetical protein
LQEIEYDYLGLNSRTFTAPAGTFLAGDLNEQHAPKDLPAVLRQDLFYGKAGGGWAGFDNLTITNTVTGARITGFTN